MGILKVEAECCLAAVLAATGLSGCGTSRPLSQAEKACGKGERPYTESMEVCIKGQEQVLAEDRHYAETPAPTMAPIKLPPTQEPIQKKLYYDCKPVKAGDTLTDAAERANDNKPLSLDPDNLGRTPVVVIRKWDNRYNWKDIYENKIADKKLLTIYPDDSVCVTNATKDELFGLCAEGLIQKEEPEYRVFCPKFED